jgi:hypothetical protein
MAARRFPPPWSVEELDACLSNYRRVLGIIAGTKVVTT